MLAAVTGGTGFVGTYLVKRLVARGDRVRLLARATSDLSVFDGLPVDVVCGDLHDAAALRRLCAGADGLFHLAADLSFWRGAREIQERVNVAGTRNVMTAAKAGGVGRVVYTSSVAAIGIPARPGVPADEENPFRGESYTYLRTKRIAERVALDACDSHGLDVVAVNPAVVYGGAASATRASGSQRIVGLIDEGVRLFGRVGPRVYPPGGYCVCDIDAVVDAHIAAYERGRRGHRYILGGHNVTLREIFEAVSRTLGVPVPTIQVPVPMLLALGAVSELRAAFTGTMPKVTWDYAVLGTMLMWYDSSKAASELGYEPPPFEASIGKAVAEYRAAIRRAQARAA